MSLKIYFQTYLLLLSVVFSAAFKLCHKSLVKFLRGIVAHLFLTVIHCGYLDNDRHISSRGDGYRKRGQLDTEYLAGLVVEAEAIVKLAVDPGLKIDDKVDLLYLLDRSRPYPPLR